MKILYKISKDWSFEEVELIDDNGKIITSISTQADCPEDNNCSRLGISESFKTIVKALTGKDIEVENVTLED